MALEGELKVHLRLAGLRVAAVGIQSTRPDVAQRLLRGRTRAEVVAAVPQIFSLCGRSQAAASALACDAAAGLLPTAAGLASAAQAVAAEVVRESTWHTLLQWPRWLGEAPTADALAAARASTTFQTAAASAGAAQAIAQAVLGMDAGAWLGLQSAAALTGWAQNGSTGAARFIAQMAALDAAWPGTLPQAAPMSAPMSAPMPAPVPAPMPAPMTALRQGPAPLSADLPGRFPALLPAQAHASWVAELAAAADADPGFAQQPVWRGQPAETGALARRQHAPLIQALLQGGRSRVAARFVARLQELALLLSGGMQPALGALTLADGSGLAWVENARGLLLHQAWLAGDRVLRYRIVAPTEWNFHRSGALVSALTQAPANDTAALQRQAQCLIHSLDPCVACQVECFDA